MAKRYRLNLSLHPGRAARLRRLQHRYGLSSMCKLAYVALDAVEAAAYRHTSSTKPDIRAEIDDMFRTFSEQNKEE